jgi:hypothetical protein
MSLSLPSLIEGAFSLTAALAWNEAAKSIVNRVVPIKDGEQDPNKKMKASIIYAILVTLFVVVMFVIYNTTRKAAGVVADGVKQAIANRGGTGTVEGFRLSNYIKL